MRDAQRRLAQGVGQFLCIEGEAGIGKSTLLAAATELLSTPKTAVSTAAAVETDRHRPLVLMRRLLPGLPTLRPQDDPIDATLAMVERRVGAGRLVLVADDVQWADDASLEVLRAIGARAEALGLLLIVATRPQPAPSGVRRLVELARAVVGTPRVILGTPSSPPNCCAAWSRTTRSSSTGALPSSSPARNCRGDCDGALRPARSLRYRAARSCCAPPPSYRAA